MIPSQICEPLGTEENLEVKGDCLGEALLKKSTGVAHWEGLRWLAFNEIKIAYRVVKRDLVLNLLQEARTAADRLLKQKDKKRCLR